MDDDVWITLLNFNLLENFMETILWGSTDLGINAIA